VQVETGVRLRGSRRGRKLGRTFCRCGSSFGCALEKAVETSPANAKHLGGADAVAIAHVKHSLDVNSANLIERKRAPGLVGAGETAVAGPAEMLGEVRDIDEVGNGGNRSAGNDVLEFADVAGPIVLQ